MIFTSAVFLTRFLPVVLFLDWGTEAGAMRRTRWLLLLLASLFFYAWWRLDHLPVLIGSIAFNYFMGARIEGAAPHGKRALLFLGVAANLLLLGAFKYTAFVSGNVFWLLRLDGFQIPEIALPLGISFFTFTQIAYLTDCLKGKRGRHGPVEYALFVTFFPHLLAGPIIHHSEMIPQFQRGRRPLDEAASDAVEGFALLAIGAAKKLVLADNLSPIADAVFGAAAQGHAPDLGQAWLGALAYTFQLYFDFSGYSDMAVGLARIFGVRFPANFDSPYKATNLVEFWRRWHMTLSRWLRDYLYIALGGNRGGPLLRYRNLFLTMVLGGLWHGAAWTFVIWGTLHGLMLAATHLVRGRFGRLAPTGRVGRGAFSLATWLGTFVFVVFAWVFFRATTLDSALLVLGGMVGLDPADGTPRVPLSGNAGDLIGLAAAIAFLAPNSIAIEKALAGRTRGAWAAAGLAGAAALAALMAGLTGPAESPFLYFNF
ncbi:MBOAT family protein [Roseomonas sp. OT10]|uniref:MBOAT family O-acyltransferase n=1 Tax=Roseomonas cutis TaxID=2897332 RepID=UPI001E2A2A12|nr:MBOAT family protein [Roseomonas sp. OT10]UFN47951.1 MBOAT family protein [Roseomonas sp. OT10]